MTDNLNARSLDVKITAVTKATVYYELAANGKAEQWRIPPESTFDTSQLEPGERYRVFTKVIRSLQWDYKAQQRIWKDRYDWVMVEHRSPKAKVTAKAKPVNQPPLADDGDLFQW